ncbi:hypothetical protein D3C78_1095070 [compost metagenome]
MIKDYPLWNYYVDNIMPSGITKPKAACAVTSRWNPRRPVSAIASCWGWALLPTKR